MPAPDWYNLIAVERGLPVGWKWYALQGVGEDRKTGGALVKGGVPTAAFTRGPRKGETNWSRGVTDKAEILITFAEYEQRRLDWEASTGECCACGGDGTEVYSMSVTEGRKTRPCSRCKGDGKARTEHL